MCTFICKVCPGSPAHRAGLRVGEHFLVFLVSVVQLGCTVWNYSFMLNARLMPPDCRQAALGWLTTFSARWDRSNLTDQTSLPGGHYSQLFTAVCGCPPQSAQSAYNGRLRGTATHWSPESEQGEEIKSPRNREEFEAKIQDSLLKIKPHPPTFYLAHPARPKPFHKHMQARK